MTTPLVVSCHALLMRAERIYRACRSRRRRTRARIAALSRRRRVGRRVVRLLLATTVLAAAFVVTAVVLYATVTDVPPLDEVPVGQAVTIQYSDGSTLARVGEVDREEIPLARIPAVVRWAFLSAEDRNFYDESGFSVRGTVRAAWSDLSGSSTQGGSGITQQLVKNLYVGDAHSLTRKLRELMIAVKLSRRYDKNTILAYYLNTAYFGRGAYGIQEAARAYFHEDAQRLTPARGALLATLLRAPSYYDPAVHPTAARQRWRYVVDGMVSTHHLTRAQANAIVFPATARPTGTDLSTTGWKHILVGRIFADLAAHGFSDDKVYDLGLTIRTTIDRRAQTAAAGAVARSARARSGTRPDAKAAVVAVDPNSGGVLAYYGGTGPSVRTANGKVDDFDYATNGYRLAGTTLQPFVLATTLSQTLTMAPGKPRYDVESPMDARACVVIRRTPVCAPAGRDGVPPFISIAGALREGSKTTFDQLAAEAGPDEVAALAHRMGVSTADAEGEPTLTDPNGGTGFGIGSGLYAVSPLDQAAAYATLAAGGVRHSTYLVRSATSSGGEVVYRHRSNAARVLDPRVANDVTFTLGPHAPTPGSVRPRSSVPAAPALGNGREAAATSSTVALSSAANSDAWTVGYTPQIATAVWFGSGDDRPIVTAAGRPMTGTDEPATVWRQVMASYLRGRPRVALPDRSLVGRSSAGAGRRASR